MLADIYFVQFFKRIQKYDFYQDWAELVRRMGVSNLEKKYI